MCLIHQFYGPLWRTQNVRLTCTSSLFGIAVEILPLTEIAQVLPILLRPSASL